MKIEGVIIKDEKDQIFFGFIKQFPGVCAQGSTVEEVKKKVGKHFKEYIEKISSTEIEMNQIGSF